jgi:DNA-binding ferritin-like protein
MDSLEPTSTKTKNILIKDMAKFFILTTTHGRAHYFVNGSDWHQQVM